MADINGYNITMEDHGGNPIYPTTSINNIISPDGSLINVVDGIIWNSEFIVLETDKICIIHTMCERSKNIIVIPTMKYDESYTYYVNSNKVVLKTNAEDPFTGIEWEVGTPILCRLQDGVLYVPSSKNNKGLFLNNNPVEIGNISDGDLLQYSNGRIIPYTPPVKVLYTPGQLKGWTFSSSGSEVATYPSGCEAGNMRVCTYGNGSTTKGTSICTSDEYDFSNYTNIVIKYTNGVESFEPVIQIISDYGSEVLEIPYSEDINSISCDISQCNFKKAKLQISVTSSGDNIHEIIIFDIKLV